MTRILSLLLAASVVMLVPVQPANAQLGEQFLLIGTLERFTLDAGPNPVALTDEKHLARVESLCRENGSRRIVACSPGRDARLIDEHLF